MERALEEEIEPGKIWERTERDSFIENLLKIRTKYSNQTLLRLNRAQREYSDRWSHIDRELGTQCAELHGHWPVREFARKLVELGKEYNTALLAVERNNHGSGVLAWLETLNYPRVFKQEEKEGWWTSAVSRPTMIENLSAALMEKPGLFHSERLLNECRTFLRDADGNTGATAGAHDDCVMAMGIAWAVRKEEAGRRPER